MAVIMLEVLEALLSSLENLANITAIKIRIRKNAAIIREEVILVVGESKTTW